MNKTEFTFAFQFFASKSYMKSTEVAKAIEYNMNLTFTPFQLTKIAESVIDYRKSGKTDLEGTIETIFPIVNV